MGMSTRMVDTITKDLELQMLYNITVPPTGGTVHIRLAFYMNNFTRRDKVILVIVGILLILRLIITLIIFR
jgi:hypothetical protein